MLKPPPREMNYEKLKIDDWISGVIEEIQHDPARKRMFEGKESVFDAVRFKFKLDGYVRPHYSRWMTFTFYEKGNLFKKYLFSLVEGASEKMDFDLHALIGMKVKTMWSNNPKNPEFQNIEMIRPEVAKIPSNAVGEVVEEVEDQEGLPF